MVFSPDLKESVFILHLTSFEFTYLSHLCTMFKSHWMCLKDVVVGGWITKEIAHNCNLYDLGVKTNIYDYKIHLGWWRIYRYNQRQDIWRNVVFCLSAFYYGRKGKCKLKYLLILSVYFLLLLTFWKALWTDNLVLRCLYHRAQDHKCNIYMQLQCNS